VIRHKKRGWGFTSPQPLFGSADYSRTQIVPAVLPHRSANIASTLILCYNKRVLELNSSVDRRGEDEF
jgi:hypothetical protein